MDQLVNECRDNILSGASAGSAGDAAAADLSADDVIMTS